MPNNLLSFSYSGIRLDFEITEDKNIYFLYAGEEKKSSILEPDYHQFSKLVEAEYLGSNGDKQRSIKLNNSSYGKTHKYVSHVFHDNEKGKELVIVTKNNDLEIETHYQFYKNVKSFSVFNIVKNISETTILLTYVSSFFEQGIVKSNSKQTYLYRATSSWNCEAQWGKFSFVDLGIFTGNGFESMGKFSLNNTGSWSTKLYLPMVVVEDERGCSLVQVENNGSWNIEISDFGSTVYLAACGPEFYDNQWSKNIKPGETFTTVQATLSFGNDFEEVIQEITKARRIMRRPARDLETLPVIYNDYMHALWDTQTTELIKPLVDLASELGCDEFCMDAGWFAVGSQWWNILGKWKEEPKNFPDGGFISIINYIKSKGMKAGFWVEIEAIGEHSPILKDIKKDWLFQMNGVPTKHNERYQLNFANPEVYKYAMDVVDEFMSLYNIDYLKIDYNVDAGVGNDWDSDSLGDGLLKHSRAFVKWLNEVMDKYPNLTIENCGSGGCRMDSEILKYCPIQSTSDQTNYRKYPYLATNVFTACTPEQAAVWSYPLNDYEKIMPTDEVVIMNMCNAMLGRIHLASFINKLPESQKDLIREGIAYYRSIIEFKKNSLPVYPKGTAKFFDDEVVGGIINENKIVLGVWNTSGKKRTVKVDLSKYNVESVKVGYPSSQHTEYNFVNGTHILEVTFSEDYGGRIFEAFISK